MSAVVEGPNHELFVKVLAQIEREPKRWNQGRWASRSACGTAYCFAGWACVLSGYQPDFTTTTTSDYEDGELHTHDLIGVAGRGISDQAADLLGFEYEEISDLFEADNDLDVIYGMTADLLGIDETVLRDKVAAEVQS